MREHIKLIVTLLAILIPSIHSFSQVVNQYGVRVIATGGIDVVPGKLQLTLGGEIRTLEVVKKISTLIPSAYIDYYANDYLSLSAGAQFYWSHSSDTFHFNYRPEIALMGKYSIKGFTFSLRERVIAKITPRLEKPNNAIFYLRSVPKIQYQISNSRFAPYFYSDIYLHFNGQHKGAVPRIGCFLGTNISINDKNKMDLKLIFETHRVGNNIERHYFGLGIGYAFN
jgi:hypothetical protein